MEHAWGGRGGGGEGEDIRAPAYATHVQNNAPNRTFLKAPAGLDVLEASPQDISAKHFLNAAGFFRGCAVAVVSCEQSCGNHFLFFCPSGLSALHAPSVATSKASTLST